MTFSVAAVIAFAMAMVAAAIVDLLGWIHWGLGWPELWGGVGIAAFALVLGFVCQVWFAIIGLGGGHSEP